MTGSHDMNVAVDQVPVVKQCSVPLCLGSGLDSTETVSPPRRRRGKVGGRSDDVVLVSGTGERRLNVAVGMKTRVLMARRIDGTLDSNISFRIGGEMERVSHLT